MPHDFVRKVHTKKGTSDPFAHEVMSAVTGFVLPLANGVPFVSPFESPSVSHGRKLSYTPILSYDPGSKVTDHSRAPHCSWAAPG